MIVNGKALLKAAPMKNMLDHKVREHGVSHGLAEIGYDLQLAQEIIFGWESPLEIRPYVEIDGKQKYGRFTLASAMEEFNMPPNLGGIVHDKSTWARKGLSVFNTVVEPSWRGFLTLELVYHGHERLVLPKGCGIAQIIFHEVMEPAHYEGKYQDQAAGPVAGILRD